MIFKHLASVKFGRALPIRAFCALMASVLAAALCALPAPGNQGRPPRASKSRVTAPPPRKGRETTVIDDSWTFLTDPTNRGLTDGWNSAAPSARQPIRVPSLWTVSAAPGYSGAAWYWREIEPPDRWKGQTVRLRFEAVAEHAEVWLNGQRLGEHRDGATPFEFNITTNLHLGTKNLLAVRVEGEAARGAGMWQGVLLMAHDEAYIADVFPSGGPLGNLTADIQLMNTSDKSGDAVLDARLLPTNAPSKEIKSSSQILSLTPRLNLTSMVINVPKKRLMPWSPDTPSLYYLDLAFHQDKDVLDTTETTTGFRDLGWQNGAITINGSALKPRSVAPDAPLPVVIATGDDSNRARSLLKKMKSSGVSVLYLDAPPPAMVTLADEEGLLIVEGARTFLKGAEAESELLDLIRRDRAHASILAWNLRGMDPSKIQQAQKLDPTRFLLVGTSSQAKLIPPRSETQDTVTPPTGLLP